MDRKVASGHLIRESPLYTAADQPAATKPMSRSAWIEVLAKRGTDRGDARIWVDAAIASGQLVPAERRYTTQIALEREMRILQIEREGRDRVSPIASHETVRCRLYSTRLTDGQRAAVELIGTTTSRVVGVQGYAGTGKSRMLEQAKRLVKEQGHSVVALAPYATQVRALRELGVEARTLASFLAAREKDLDPNTLLVIDEAGTVPTRQMEQAMKLAEKAGARVVLLGDTQQTKAIEAGRPFDQLQAAGMQTALMQEIQRQKDPHFREAVALAARGEAAASLASIEDVREIKNDRERHAAIARDYARLSAEERSTTIVVAGTNEARREINRAIREDLGLAGQGCEYSILVRRDTTQAERAFAKNYTPGEMVRAERDYPRLGLERGILYEVTENGMSRHVPAPSSAERSATPGSYTGSYPIPTLGSSRLPRLRVAVQAASHPFRTCLTMDRTSGSSPPPPPHPMVGEHRRSKKGDRDGAQSTAREQHLMQATEEARNRVRGTSRPAEGTDLPLGPPCRGRRTSCFLRGLRTGSRKWTFRCSNAFRTPRWSSTGRGRSFT